MTTPIDLDPAGLEAAIATHDRILALPATPDDQKLIAEIIRAYFTARSTAPEAGASIDWKRVDDALVSCAGLLKTLCRDEIGDTCAAELEYVRSALAARSAPEAGKAVTLRQLQTAHIERQAEWCPDQVPDLSFRGNEMAGEVGEACNVIKKLERERHGWRGSRATKEQLAEELGDVIHTAILCAITAGIDIEPATVAKFNSTSEKNGLSTFIPALASAPAPSGAEELCQDCPPVGYPTDTTRCLPCPRRAAPQAVPAEDVAIRLREQADHLELGMATPLDTKAAAENLIELAREAAAALTASEAEATSLRTDAERWRALMSSQRMHFMGCAGIDLVNKPGTTSRKTADLIPIMKPGEYHHFGMEFWSEHKAFGNPEYPDDFERSLLIAYVDDLRARTFSGASE